MTGEVLYIDHLIQGLQISCWWSGTSLLNRQLLTVIFNFPPRIKLNAGIRRRRRRRGGKKCHYKWRRHSVGIIPPGVISFEPFIKQSWSFKVWNFATANHPVSFYLNWSKGVTFDFTILTFNCTIIIRYVCKVFDLSLVGNIAFLKIEILTFNYVQWHLWILEPSV